MCHFDNGMFVVGLCHGKDRKLKIFSDCRPKGKKISSPWALILFLVSFLLALGVVLVENELLREVVLTDVVVRLLVLPELHKGGLNWRLLTKS